MNAPRLGEQKRAPPGSPPEGADISPLTRAFLEKRESLVLFLAARTRSMAAAEDLVQELYLKVAAVDRRPRCARPGRCSTGWRPT